MEFREKKKCCCFWSNGLTLSQRTVGAGWPATWHSKRTVFAVGNTCDLGVLTKDGGTDTCAVESTPNPKEREADENHFRFLDYKAIISYNLT